MSDALFDVTLFGGPSKAARERTQPTPVTTVAVSGEAWNGTSASTPGILHYTIGRKVIRRGKSDVAAIVAACGVVVVPHTFDPDEVRIGCARCEQLKP